MVLYDCCSPAWEEGGVHWRFRLTANDPGIGLGERGFCLDLRTRARSFWLRERISIDHCCWGGDSGDGRVSLRRRVTIHCIMTLVCVSTPTRPRSPPGPGCWRQGEFCLYEDGCCPFVLEVRTSFISRTSRQGTLGTRVLGYLRPGTAPCVRGAVCEISAFPADDGLDPPEEACGAKARACYRIMRSFEIRVVHLADCLHGSGLHGYLACPCSCS